MNDEGGNEGFRGILDRQVRHVLYEQVRVKDFHKFGERLAETSRRLENSPFASETRRANDPLFSTEVTLAHIHHMERRRSIYLQA